jgi:4-hydroxy-3-polyprenylbenzoate decarboxylase
MQKILVAITGASGSVYGLKLLELLKEHTVEVHGIISEAGKQVLKWETGLEVGQIDGVHRWHGVNNLAAEPSSGSAGFSAMVVIPCTMGTLGAVAGGLSINLIHRAADVMLKEQKPLVLAVRETPFNRNHLKNMLQALEAGATIFPCMPAFYNRPTSLEEMARNFAARICEFLGFAQPDLPRWQGEGDNDHA